MRKSLPVVSIASATELLAAPGLMQGGSRPWTHPKVRAAHGSECPGDGCAGGLTGTIVLRRAHAGDTA